MSIYRKPKSPYWWFDFVHRGRRHVGSTGVPATASKRKAEAVERKVREEAALGLLNEAALLTIDQAASKWFDEVGSDLATAAQADRRLRQLVKLIGANTRLKDITTRVVQDAINKRARQTFSRGKGRHPKHYAVSNRTVNLDVISTLRPILRRARRNWEAKGLPEINWTDLKKPEPKPKPREFTDAQLDSVLAAVQPHWHDFVRFAARYGARLDEMFFHPSALDVEDRDNARVTLRERKNDEDHVIPLTPDDAAWLAARKGRAEAAGLDTIWYRELAGARLKALSYWGAESALRRAMTTTGLRASTGMKGAHDLRRNSAMKILRATGNLRVAQQLLGHASIQSTLVYAHAVEADLRAGLAAVPHTIPTPPSSDSAEGVEDQAVNEG